jgi:CheY-like chemotaxis protein
MSDSPDSSPAGAHTSKSILFIEGEDRNRQYYAERLKAACPDLRIYEAASGKTGLKLYDAHLIDCVILELGLPDMSGFEVLTKLVPVARAPEVPVIVLTHLSSLPLLQVARLNGAQTVLQKATASGDDLEKAVLKALATIQRDPKKD